jgi:recombination protein RecR
VTYEADPIRTLTSQLARLPGIGERTATRLVLHLLKSDRENVVALSRALLDVAERVRECPRCATLTAGEGECGICSDARRDPRVLCVVASVQDLNAIESTSEYRGRYHVLHGTLSPLDGIGPEELRLGLLFQRLRAIDRDVEEVILATPPTVDGEATALLLARQLAPSGIRVSRIASGVPVGGDLQYADRLTIARALEGRRSVHD